MPTARELLEQADALMRRHRGGAPEVPASSHASPVVSPRAIQREPISPSVARTSLPVDPTESPMFEVDVPEAPAAHPTAVSPNAPSAKVSPAPVVFPAAADIPLLTEAVPLEETDDVPLLTDAVEEIDFPPVAEAPADDDPSLWLDTEQGSEMIFPEAAPRLAPSVQAETQQPHPDEPAPGRDPLGLDHPAPGFELPASPAAEAADVAPFGEIPQSEIPTELRDAAARAAPLEPAALEAQPPEAQAPEAVESAPIPASDEQLPIEESAHDAADSSASASDNALLDELAQDFIASRPSATLDLEPAPEALRDDDEPRAMPADAAPPAIPPLDEARVREIAEEISMQVLQRIDIFADTGLRSQLGDLLKPAIERASGELVTAINQHVGELLRAFVAEAVDREIEQWRRRQQP